MSEDTGASSQNVALIERAVAAYLARIMRWAVPLVVLVAVVSLVAATTSPDSERQVRAAGNASSNDSLTTSDEGASTADSGSAVADQSPSVSSAGQGGAAPAARGAAVVTGRGVSRTGVDCSKPGARQMPWSKYAPPCVAAFSGNNGGATAHGVTGDKITIVVGYGNASTNAAIQSLAGPATPDDKAWADTIKAYAKYFDTQFETYGRKVEVKTYQMKSDYVLADMGRDTAAAQADAQTSKDLGAFIDLTALTNTSSLPYGNALAQLGVMAWTFPLRTTENYAKHAPYLYNFIPDGTKWSRWATSLVCQRMAGMPAIYAAGSEQNKPRKFGVIGVNIPEWEAAADLVGSMMKKECGVDATQLRYEFDLGTFSQYGASMMAQMREAGVTTILCVCDPLGPIFMTQSATDDGYYPEWLFHNQGIVDSNYDAEQLKHSFSNGPALPPASQTEALRVFRSAFPNTDPPSRPYFTWIYGIMMNIYSAVQMAGPNLTPQRFYEATRNLPRSLDGGDYGPWWGNAEPSLGGVFTPWTGMQVTRWSATAPSPDGGNTGYWSPCPGPSYYPLEPVQGWEPAKTQVKC
jgi:hypothetical protein